MVSALKSKMAPKVLSLTFLWVKAFLKAALKTLEVTFRVKRETFLPQSCHVWNSKWCPLWGQKWRQNTIFGLKRGQIYFLKSIETPGALNIVKRAMCQQKEFWSPLLPNDPLFCEFLTKAPNFVKNRPTISDLSPKDPLFWGESIIL